MNKTGWTETNRMQTRRLAPLWLLLSTLVMLVTTRTALAETVLQDVTFASLPDKKVEVQMSFNGAPPVPKAYMIETPPRLVLDLWDTSSEMSQKMLAVKSGDVDSLHFAEANGRIRVVANLNEVAGYNVRTAGNNIYLEIGGAIAAVSTSAHSPVSANKAPAAAAIDVSGNQTQIQGIDFHRLEGDRGRITIDLSNSAAGLDIVEESNNVVVNLIGARLAGGQQRMDVQDFATPVNYIDTMVKGDNTTVLIKPGAAPYDYMAYQSGNQLVLDFKPMTQADQQAQKDLFPYSGEKIDLNFQNVEIRTVLQIIAEVAEKNLVVSDNVQGDITLRLKNVPWDQALDIVLKTKGLDKREAGNVLLVGTLTEIAEREAVELQSQQQETALAPLITDFIQIDYRKASDIKDRIMEAKLVSERGFVLADDETNTLMIRETGKQAEEIRKTIKRFDLEVPQVMIQARLVTASTDFTKNIGVRWGFADRGDALGNWDVGSAIGFEGEANGTTFDGLQVDLGVPDTVGSLAVGFLSNNFLLSAELAAVESDGLGEIISQPKVITTNGKKAAIHSGQEIPVFKVNDETGIKEVDEWKEILLKLDVTPQLIPGGRVQLDIAITDDKLGEEYDDLGNRIINTRQVTTSVVVNDGETVVLGGVFEQQTQNTVEKVPFFGDLPLIGAAFRNKTELNEKRELLIFITPQMIRESLRR